MAKREEIKSHSISESPYDGIFLRQRGSDETFSNQTEPHRDDYYLFGVISKGHASVAIDFKELYLSAGEALILTPGQVHFSIDSSADLSGWIMAIAPEHLSDSEIEAIERYSLNPLPIPLSAKSLEQLGAIFEVISQRIAESAIALPLAAAVRSIILSDLPSTAAQSKGRIIEITQKFKALLDKQIRTERQPSKYAAMLNISPAYLNEAVKTVTGLSVSHLIRNKAVMLAKRMLRHTSLTAQEIAYELGYDDYAYFSKLFKKEAGMSPSQFRMKP